MGGRLVWPVSTLKSIQIKYICRVLPFRDYMIFFKWGKVLRHQILVMTFQDEPKLVYSCKLLDIYFSRKKKYFWQILLIFLSNPKFQENQCFFMKLLIWMKLKLQNFSKKLFWIKTRVKISKLVIKVNWHSTFWPK